jgi:hypothetical protein
MKAARQIFITGALKPAPNPTIMTFGKKSLYDPVSMDYGKPFGDLGRLINPTIYRYGCYMQVDTSQSRDKVTGPTVQTSINEACPIQPTDQISFNWKKGNLVFDALPPSPIPDFSVRTAARLLSATV